MLSLVTGIAHYTKLLVRIGLRACTESQPPGVDFEIQLDRFLRELENRETPTVLAQSLDAHLDGPPSPKSSFPEETDLCVGCAGVVEDRCFSSQTEAGLGFWHLECLRCKACGSTGAYMYDRDVDQLSSGEWTMQCSYCRVIPPSQEYRSWSTVDIYIVRLYVALARFMKAVDADGPIVI
jgi:hypothetical protein